MTYPPFYLEQALAGEPVAYRYKDEIKKGYLYKSHVKGNRMLVEVALSEVMYHLIYADADNILGMWQEAPKFEHWNLLDDSMVLIEKEPHQDFLSRWVAKDGKGSEFDLPLASSLFPDCPDGTVIKKPEEEA